MVGTTTTKRETLMNEFLNGESQRVYAKGRLYTRENGDTLQLVAYGHEVLAELEDGHVHLYTGHHSTVSRTVTGYVKVLGSTLSDTEGFEVTVHEGEAPNTGIGTRVSEAAKYISNYVGDFRESMSSVENDAVETVERYLQIRLREEFEDE
jgi:hypothetical protein